MLKIHNFEKTKVEKSYNKMKKKKTIIPEKTKNRNRTYWKKLRGRAPTWSTLNRINLQRVGLTWKLKETSHAKAQTKLIRLQMIAIISPKFDPQNSISPLKEMKTDIKNPPPFGCQQTFSGSLSHMVEIPPNFQLISQKTIQSPWAPRRI